LINYLENFQIVRVVGLLTSTSPPVQELTGLPSSNKKEAEQSILTHLETDHLGESSHFLTVTRTWAWSTTKFPTNQRGVFFVEISVYFTWKDGWQVSRFAASLPIMSPPVITRRYKRNATTEPMVTDQSEEPQLVIEEKPEIKQPSKWETIITTIIGELSLSILRGPPNLDGDGQWMPGSCGFFARLSSDCPSSYLSNIKIDKKIIAVLETANTQNKTREGQPINELFVYGQDTVNITKPNVAEDVHVIKNNRYLFFL
jgi:hypothetical protein